MPLFKKTALEIGSLADANRKVLLRCRMLLIRDMDVPDILEYMSSDEGFKPDVREQINSFPTREQRVGVFLDRLESRNDKTFYMFMDAVKEHYKHLHYWLDETMKSIHDSEAQETQHREKVALSGDAVRKLVRNNIRKNVSNSQGSESNEGSLDVEILIEEKEEEDYIDCYAIPMRGRLQKETWIKHINYAAKDEGKTGHCLSTYMAGLVKNAFFKRTEITDIPDGVRKPSKYCNVFFLDKDEATSSEQYGKRTADTTKESGMSRRLSIKETVEKFEFEEKDEDDIPPSTPPPPVPPKPDNLPPLSLIPSSSRASISDQDGSSDFELKPPPRTSSMRKSEQDAKVKPPVPQPKPKIDGLQLVKEINVSAPAKGSETIGEPITNGHDIPQVPPRAPFLKRKDLDLDPADSDTLKRLSDTSNDSTFVSSSDDASVSGPLETDFPVNEQPIYNGSSGFRAGDPERASLSDIYNSSTCSAVSTATLTADQDQEMRDKALEETDPLDDEDYEAISPSTEPSPPRVIVEECGPGRPSTNEALCPIATSEDLDSDAMVSPSKSSTGLSNSEGSPEDRDDSVTFSIHDESSKASGDSLDSNNAPDSVGERSTVTTDSGIDSSTHPPVLPMRKGSRNNRLPVLPSLLPSKSLSEVDISANEVTSDSDDSYYEDIDIVDQNCPSPSMISSTSYLDPKSYFRGLERAAKYEKYKDGKFTFCQTELEPPKKVYLRKGDHLIAENQEVYIPNAEAGANNDTDNVLQNFVNMSLVYDKEGNAFYIPTNLLKRFGDPEGEPWFFPIPLSSRQATLFLSAEKQEGCFIVYAPVNSTSKATYNISLCRKDGDVVHYHVVENAHGDVMIEGHDHSFMNIQDLVQYFQRNKSHLATRLRRPLKEAKLPIMPGYHYDSRYEISRSSLNLTGKIVGKGHFGVVCSALYKGFTVAVKVLQRTDIGIVEEDEFIEEAKVMMGLKHDHVVRLVGVSCSARPFFIVTEFASRGSLRDCLRNHSLPAEGIDIFFDICIQVTAAMYYLEGQKYLLHRDVAARNYLVSEDMCVKLSDFGRARFVTDDHYQASKSEKISIKWAAPEVLMDSVYSTKADVWSLGVVYWEIFSAGDRPYTDMSSEQATMYVIEGGRLDKPVGCSPDLYSIMKQCWRESPDERPSFTALYDKLKSKSSIYYVRTVRAEKTTSLPLNVSSSVKPLSPTKPKTPTSAKAATLKPQKSRKSNLYESKHEARQESMTDDHVDYGRKVSQEDVRTPSSSEVSLASAQSFMDPTKEDMERGGLIRKSLRKFGVMKKTKKKNSKSELPKEDELDRRSQSQTQYYSPG